MKKNYSLIPGKEVTIKLTSIKGLKVAGIKLKVSKKDGRIHVKAVYEKDEKQQNHLLYRPDLN